MFKKRVSLSQSVYLFTSLYTFLIYYTELIFLFEYNTEYCSTNVGSKPLYERFKKCLLLFQNLTIHRLLHYRLKGVRIAFNKLNVCKSLLNAYYCIEFTGFVACVYFISTHKVIWPHFGSRFLSIHSYPSLTVHTQLQPSYAPHFVYNNNKFKPISLLNSPKRYSVYLLRFPLLLWSVSQLVQRTTIHLFSALSNERILL